MFLYIVTNNISGNSYYGITNDPRRRFYSHRSAIRRGVKSRFYDAVRSYGEEKFTWELVVEGDDEFIKQLEIDLIASDPNCYNMHPGGGGGFSMRNKTEAERKEWRKKLSVARQGRKPALGMKHSEETKALCGTYGRARWDKYGRYPGEVLDFGFAEANRKFGISKTHYYRLRKAASDDSQA